MNKIIKSKKDAEVFFIAIVNPDEPNEELKELFKKWCANKDNYIITNLPLETISINSN